MVKKADYRPTVVRANAPFRGPTTVEQYHNFVQETVHDLRFLYTKMTENESTNERGIAHSIDDNFAFYTHGEEQAFCNIPTKATLCKTTDAVVTDGWKDIAWEAYGQCKITKMADRIRLENPALDAPCGMRFSVMAEEGERFYVRLTAKGVSGDVFNFAFGSESVINGRGHFQKQLLSTEKEESFDTRFSTDERGMVMFNVDVSRQPAILKTGVIDILSYEVYKMEEIDCDVSPLEVDLKPRLNLAERNLNQML